MAFYSVGCQNQQNPLRNEKSGATAPPFNVMGITQAARDFIAFSVVIARWACYLVMKRKLDTLNVRKSHLFNSLSPS